MVKHWASTQKVIALSSGETALYGTVRATSEGIGLPSLMADLGLNLQIEVHTDSTAAKGIASRKGTGTVRHIDVSYLWIQDKITQKQMKHFKVLGTPQPSRRVHQARRT